MSRNSMARLLLVLVIASSLAMTIGGKKTSDTDSTDTFTQSPYKY